MAQEDVVEVNKTLSPWLSVVRQYLGEMLCTNNAPLAEAPTQPLLAPDKSAVSDDLSGEAEGTSVVALGEYMYIPQKAFFFNLY